jgi:hypothetical protein
LWDSIINTVHEANTPEYEIIARELATRTRVERRVLSQTLFDALEKANTDEKTHLFRRMVEYGNKVYCFLFSSEKISREDRKSELALFCYVSRGTSKNASKVLGIATEKGMLSYRSYDFCYFEKNEWTVEDEKRKDQIQKEMSILKNPIIHSLTFEEYQK